MVQLARVSLRGGCAQHDDSFLIALMSIPSSAATRGSAAANKTTEILIRSGRSSNRQHHDTTAARSYGAGRQASRPDGQAGRASSCPSRRTAPHLTALHDSMQSKPWGGDRTP